MIDSHCHLNFNAFKGDFLEVAQRAKDSGLKKIIIPGSDNENSKLAINISNNINDNLGNSFAFAAIGIHPVHVRKKYDFAKIEKLAAFAAAIGECGLDFFHDKEKKTSSEQIYLLQKHFDLAVKSGLPLIFHNRDADEETLSFIDRQKEVPKIVFHCFSSNWKFAEQILEKGFSISFTGNITYGNKSLKKVVERASLNKIMIETDSPYIVPEPLRSEGVKRNEPAYVCEIAKKIAEIKDIPLNEVVTATTQNAIDFFQI